LLTDIRYNDAMLNELCLYKASLPDDEFSYDCCAYIFDWLVNSFYTRLYCLQFWVLFTCCNFFQNGIVNRSNNLWTEAYQSLLLVLLMSHAS